MDLSSLLKPLEGDPVGPDLSYDAGRLAIEAAFAVSADGDRSGDIKWADVIRAIRAQAELTRDLWLGIYLARAGAASGQLDVVAEGAELLAGLAEEHWPLVHPKLEDVDFQGRRSACASLAHPGEFGNPLRRVVLLSHPRLGAFSLNDLDRFEQGGDSEAGYGAFRALVEQVDADAIGAIVTRVAAIRTALHRLDAVLVAQAGDETGVDYSPTYAILTDMEKRLRRLTGAADQPVAADADRATAEPATVGSEPEAVARGSATGRIESRDDVLRVLDALVDYYRRREPASPVPLALQRAREWVPMSFMQVLADIAPGNVDDARRVLMSQAMIAAAEPSSSY